MNVRKIITPAVIAKMQHRRQDNGLNVPLFEITIAIHRNFWWNLYI